MKSTLLPAAVLAIAAWLPAAAVAGDGHDHGEAAPSSAGPALPRFTAVSEQFELVGVVDGRRITFYLDHADTNTPVQGAKLAVEIGAAQLDAQSHGDGEFEAELAQALPPGVVPVTATVTTPQATDLLAGELDLHGPEPAQAAHAAGAGPRLGWIAAAAAALVAAALFAVRHRRRAAATPVAGGAA